MAKIQKGTVVHFLRILLHNLPLDVDTPHHHLKKRCAVALLNCLHMVEQPFVVAGIPDQPMLENLPHAAGELKTIEGLECADIKVYHGRLMEGTDHILVLVKINPCLSADTRINL